MQARNLSILIGLLCLAAAGGIAFMSQESLAVERPPSASGDPAGKPAAAGDGAEDTRIGAVTAEDGVYSRSSGAGAPVAAAAVREQRVDTTGWTTGIVRGDIQLSVSTLDKLRSMTVVVEELRSAFANDGHFERPNRLLVPVELGQGTPTFEVTGVPFSEYPYVVTVHAPGLNGSRRTIVVDAEHALVDDVVLTITPGAPFSILLRDQDSRPHPDVDLTMLPVGEPHGRPRHRGTTDNFGSVVFDGVLAGDYELTATLQGQPFGSPERVTVQPGSRMFASKVQGQGHSMTIPRGVPMQVTVHDARGYGVPDAKVTATATDRIRLTKLEATTDVAGRVAFAHLQPGVWQITVEREHFQRVDLQLPIQPDQEPIFRDIKLVRTRW